MNTGLACKTNTQSPRPRRNRRIAAALMCTVLLASAAASAATPCDRLSAVTFENARVTAAVAIAGPSFAGLDGRVYNEVPPFCKVSVVATPTPDSLINIELWLPTAAHWNARFQGIGNGGYGGSTAIAAPVMMTGLKNGFAVATTDMGTAPSTTSNADLLIGRPQKWVDFGSRATHLMTVLSKQLIRSYFDREPAYSYFNGCSTGGQQGMMSAQRYPADYDGILAGAPAHNRTHLHTLGVSNYNAMLATALSRFTPSQTKLITDSVLAACTVKSGGLAGDPFLTDPRPCDWDPAELQCGALSGLNCLMPDQVAAARKIYAGVRNPATGQLIVPGSVRGSENDTQFGWVSQAKGTEPPYSSLFKWVFGPAWISRTFDYDRDMASVDDLLASTLNANNPDLGPFKARGGKLISYHGTADPLIPPQESINYYLRVIAAQGSSTSGLKRTQNFFRLFMVPGLAHCAAGPGPNAFGNQFSGTLLAAPPLAGDAAHDAFRALQQWVEQGVAPDRLIAAKYVQDQPSQGVQMTRPLCPYPQYPKYSGSGAADAAGNFVCVDNRNNRSTLNPIPAPEYLR